MLELLHDGRAKIAVVGLGYVGLPLAVAFSRHFSVIGYDSDEEKIADCRAGRDPMGELAAVTADIEFTKDARPQAAEEGDARHRQASAAGQHRRLRVYRVPGRDGGHLLHHTGKGIGHAARRVQDRLFA